MFNIEDIEDFQIAFKSYPLQEDIEELEPQQKVYLLDEFERYTDLGRRCGSVVGWRAAPNQT